MAENRVYSKGPTDFVATTHTHTALYEVHVPGEGVKLKRTATTHTCAVQHSVSSAMHVPSMIMNNIS